jgi:hypothetical protein
MPSTSELIRINREVPRIKAAIKDELDMAPSSYTDPGGYLADFVKNPLGKSYDFGEISKEAAQGIGRRPGPIRVELGDSATSGLIGIIKKTSSADVLAAGYGSMSLFIYRVGNSYTDIYDAIDNGAFLLVRERKGDGRFEVLKVKTGYQGASWVVLEAFLCRKGYLESKRLLWTRTGTGTTPVSPVPIPPPVENLKPIDEVKEDSKPSQVMESAVPVEEWEQKILDAKDFMEIRAVVLRQIGLAKLKRRSDAKKAEVNEAVSINLEAMKDAVGAQFQNSKGKVILLSQSTKKENTYQVTYMDEEGPSGHTEFSSMEQAIRSISGEFSEGPPVGDSTFRTTRVIPKPVERIKTNTEVNEKHKKLIAKIKNAKDHDKKTSLWYDADLSLEEGDQIVRQMVLSLPGEYQLFGRGGGNSLVDNVFEVYGKIPSQVLNESFMLGMSVLYPDRVSASFTHDLEKVTISDGKPKKSLYLSRKEVIDGLKAHTEDIPSYIYLDKDGGSWRPNWDSERIVDFKLLNKLVNEGYLESDGIDGMLYVPVSKKSTDLKGLKQKTSPNTSTDTKLYGDLEKDDIGTIFATITKDRSSQGRSKSIELLFGDEEEWASYDDGVEFSSPETQARWETARDYAADIDHAIRVQDDTELRSLLEEAKKDYQKNLSKAREEFGDVLSDSAARRNRRGGDRHSTETTPILEDSETLAKSLIDGSMDYSHPAEWWGDKVKEAETFEDILKIFGKIFPFPSASAMNPNFSWKGSHARAQKIMALYDDCKTNEGNESYTDQLIRRKRLGDALSRATTYILNTLGTELEKEIRVYAFGGESGRNWMNSGEVGKAIAAQILNDGEKLYYEIIPQDLKLKSAQIPSSIDDMNDQITKISEVYHKRHDEAWKKYSRFSDQTRTDLGYDAVKEELYEIVRTVEKFEFTKEYRDAKARLAAIDEHARTITDPYYDEHIGKLDAERNQKIQAINKAMNQIVPDIFNPVIDSIIESSGISKEEADAWAHTIDCKVFSRRKGTDRYGVDQIKEDLSKLYRITGGSVKTINFNLIRGNRSTASTGTATINASDAFKQSSLYHEFGHIAESVLAIASKHWTRSRADTFKNGNPIIKKLSSLCPGTKYRKDETAYKDSFFDPYVGKVYDHDASEVVSMGIQMLADPNELYILMTKDPEHFKYLLGVISYWNRGEKK